MPFTTLEWNALYYTWVKCPLLYLSKFPFTTLQQTPLHYTWVNCPSLYLSEFPFQANVVDAGEVVAEVGRKVKGQVVDVVESCHPAQEHQQKHHQWRPIWCHTDLALPTRTSMETTSVETDLVSYQLRITNKNISGNNISGDWFGVILTWHYQLDVVPTWHFNYCLSVVPTCCYWLGVTLSAELCYTVLVLY